MTIAVNALAFLAALLAMEGVAWATHRFLMHGPCWSWHASHHAPRRGGFERNDLFGLVFAVLCTAIFWQGAQPGWAPLWWAAAGMSTYGILYALVHDGLVHRRFPLPFRAKRGYLARLAEAHHLHHATHAREGAVSFGFLMPPDIAGLRRRLRERQASPR